MESAAVGAMVRPSLAPPLVDAAEGFAAIALAAVACDGELSTLEARELRRQLEFRRPYRDAGPEAMIRLLDRLLQLLRDQGWQQLVAQAAPLLSADQRETALALAGQLTQADHVESTLEQGFLKDLAKQLAIPEERAATIHEVIAVLNRDSLAS
jgi:hypothetical protein